MLRIFGLLLLAALCGGGALAQQPFNPNFLQDGAGAVPRTLQERARDVVHVKDFGARCDGKTNDMAAFQRADAVAHTIHVSGGTCLISNSGTLSSFYHFAEGATVRPASGITLRFSGHVSAGIYRIFDLSAGGTVAFGTAANTWNRQPQDWVYPDWWGALGLSGGDDTTAVQAAFDSHRPVRFARSYPVTQVSITGSEQIVDFAGHDLKGVSAVPRTSVLQVKAGYSRLINISVDAQRIENYQSAIHWYTNDLTAHYPGFNQWESVFVRNALIGMMIGALPSQADPIPAQGTVQADGVATDAPLSESYVHGLKCYQAIKCLYVRQPNGKITFSQPVLIASNAEWSGAGASAEGNVSPLVVASDGSEVHIVGGALENIEDDAGSLASINGGTVFITGTVIETGGAPFYISGNSRLSMSQIMNFGTNGSSDQHFFEVDDGAIGWLNITDSRVLWPGGTGFASSSSLVKTTATAGAAFAANFGKFTVNLHNVELRDPSWNAVTTYEPVVNGAEMTIKQSELVTYDGTGATRTVVHRIDDDKKNLLDGQVDTSNYTITAYGANGDATSGGWTFDVTNTASWGSAASGLTLDGKTVDTALRVTAAAGATNEISAVTPKLAVQPMKTYRLRGWIKTATSSTPVHTVRVRYYKFDNTAASTASEDRLSLNESQIGTAWRPLSLFFKTPKDATKVDLFLYTTNGGDIYYADLEIL